MISKFKNIHQGKRCFILGSGPSIKRQNLIPLKNEFTFCSNWFINHNQIDTLNIDYYCAYDEAFVKPVINKIWREKLLKLSGVNFFFPSKWIKKDILANSFHINYDDSTKIYRDNKFCADIEDVVYDGGTVIINFCLPLAIYMGFTEIILLGVDTDYNLSKSKDLENAYFYAKEEQHTKNKHNQTSEKRWIENALASYEIVQRYAKTKNITILNATDGGNLDVYKRVVLEDYFTKDLS